VATLPRNPAQAAAEQQELAEAARTAQILGSMFPEEWKMNVDGRDTIKKWIDKARVTLITLRDEGQVKAAVTQMAQLVKGTPGGAGDAGGGMARVTKSARRKPRSWRRLTASR
jgi:hypothetical protein